MEGRGEKEGRDEKGNEGVFGTHGNSSQGMHTLRTPESNIRMHDQ